ncbi:hypothetical protein ACROYT_G037906 [Oculina patagonica]
MFCSFARAASSIPCGNRQVREGNDELLLTSLETLTAQLETWKIQEKDLLLNRAGIQDVNDEQKNVLTICSAHRFELAKHWRPSTACCHPEHTQSTQKRKVSIPDRYITPDMAKEIMLMYGLHCIIGSRVCRQCREKHACYLKQFKSSQQPSSENIAAKSITPRKRFPIPPEVLSSPSGMEDSLISDEDYKQPLTPATAKTAYNQYVYKLHEATGISEPFRHLDSVLMKEWNDLHPRTQHHYASFAKQGVRPVLESIAPGQGEELWNYLKNSSIMGLGNNDNDDEDEELSLNTLSDSTLRNLIDAYNNAQSSKSRKEILSIFAQNFTRKQLKDLIPGLTDFRIKEARKHCKEHGPGIAVPTAPIHRFYLSENKVDHTLRFITSDMISQDTAYGTSKIKLESGVELVVPKPIRKLIPARIIAQYTKICDESGFKPASVRTLFRILEVCPASTRKSLQGLDNYTADGSEAFENLEEVISKLYDGGMPDSKADRLRSLALSCKRYLKQDYSTHVVNDSTSDNFSVSPDHCRFFALSDPKKEQLKQSCTHSHLLECDRCQELRDLFLSLEEEIGKISEQCTMASDDICDLRFLLDDSKDKIEQWKAHILRSVNQEEGKQEVLDQLQPTEALLVEDWAMKFLPLHFREKSAEFYGKRGINWHVTAVIRKTQECSLSVYVFVHVFDSCDQNQITVASITQNTLFTLKELYPELTGVYLRSDNAGCYHGGYLLTSLPSIGHETGIRVIGYDFSEAQHGKDICDRKTATMRQHARRFVAETKTDILTARDLKKALESNGGVKGCRVSVAEMPQRSSQIDVKNVKIKGISQIHNIRYEEGGMRFWKAFDIGKGERMLQDDMPSIEIPKVKVLQAFPETCRSSGAMAGSAKHTEGETASPTGTEEVETDTLFECPIDGCICSFDTETELQRHLDFGNHVRRLHRESQFDHIRRRYADMINDELSKPLFAANFSCESEQSGQGVNNITMGWALKTHKSARFSETVKAYLNDRFLIGEETGNKASPT